MRPDAINWAETQDSVALTFLPTGSMHRTLWRWIVVVVVVQVTVTAAALVALQGPWRTIGRGAEHGVTIVQFAADQLTGRELNRNNVATQAVLDQLLAKPTVVFAAVVDERGTPIMRGMTDAGAWDEYVESVRGQLPQAPGGAGLAAADVTRNLLVLETPVVSRIGTQHRLIMGVEDVSARRALLDGLIAMGLGLLVVMLVLLPLTYRKLRRWMAGLHQLHAALRNLAQNAEPKPLQVGGQDEVAYLAIAFNDMASRLIASRRALVEANKSLEQLVDVRTEELRTAAMKMETLATSDTLTGLANRQTLTTHMQSMFKSSVRTDLDLVCMAIDLDDFKAVNDALGHDTGDEVLQLASDVFRATLRANDLAARLGSDEFVLLLALEDSSNALPIARRLIERFHNRCAEMLNDAKVSAIPSMSIGIASRKQTEVDVAAQLLKLAESALEGAKQTGKGQVQVWHQQPGGQDLPQAAAPANARR